MPSIFSKNCVLMGEVDSYCLVCCKHLPVEHDVLAHIHHSKHKHNLSSHEYFDKFQHDYIRKVAGIYFCELCNMTFPTAAKVGLHVTERTHFERKTEPMLTRADKCIMFQENTLITENAWHGLVDDTCVLCNVEFDDDFIHKSEQKHILNLIRSRVIISANNDIYRRVDGIYQCLTCDKIISANIIEEHLKSIQHKSLLTKCNGNENDIKNKDLEHITADIDVGASHKSSGSDTESSKGAKSNRDEGKTYTRPLLTKMEDQSSSASIPKDAESFAKQHGLSVKNNNIYCNTSTEVAATPQSIKEHVEGKKHTDKLSKASNDEQTPIKLKKVLMKDFATQIGLCKDATTTYIVINNTIVVDGHSFYGIKYSGNKQFSQLYDIELNSYNLFEVMSAQHKAIHNECFIITSVENEFIRELKPNRFNCVYCGVVVHCWGDMLKHLDTVEHNECKGKYEVLACLCRNGVIKVLQSPEDIFAAFPFSF